MATCEQETEYSALELPAEFEDLAGLLHTDLQAIVGMVTERAHERLFLTRREHSQLQAALWNRLTAALNATLEPLTAENR
jgi:hypothetical protein